MVHNTVLLQEYVGPERVFWAEFLDRWSSCDVKYNRNLSWQFDDEDKKVPLEDAGAFYRIYQAGSIAKNWTTMGWNGSGDAIYLVRVYHNIIDIFAKARTLDLLDEVVDNFKKVYRPVSKANEDDKVVFYFWSKNKEGEPVVRMRKIDTPKFQDLEVNYSRETWGQIQDLLSMKFDENDSGKLILWYGVPGTGKTHALRALAKEWEDWCKFNYFIFPEDFFYSNDYMIQAVLEGPDDNPYDVDDEGNVILEEDEKWQLFIFEDAGEFLSKDAREKQGQGLSRLLNLADGIIGQGLKVLVLITTNEDIRDFHEAVSRPGRTSSIVEFNTLKTSEAENWAKANNVSLNGNNSKSYTIAELYNGSLKTRRKKVGF